MKRIHIITGLTLALAISAHGQVSNPSIITVTSDPTGVACTNAVPMQAYNGNYYGCDNTGHMAAQLSVNGGTLTGPITVPSITVPSDGVHAQDIGLIGQATAPAIAANSAGITAPASASFTAYRLQLPATNPAANQLMAVGAPDGTTHMAPVRFINQAPAVTLHSSGSPYTMLGVTGYYYNNTASTFNWVLDAPTAGKQYCFGNYSGRTGVLTITSTTTVYIVYKGVNGTVTTGTLVSGGAAGDFVCMVGTDSTHYMVTGAGYGTWTNN